MVWVIGGVWAGGICYLNFPSSTSYSNIEFSSTDENEKYLSYFDSTGIPVIPAGRAGQCRYGHGYQAGNGQILEAPLRERVRRRPEWYKSPSYPGGKPVTDAEAPAGTARHAYKSSYTLALTHWMTNHMPPTYRTGLYFLYDGLGHHRSLGTATNYYVNWGKAFPNSPVGIYLGFTEDKKWWSTYRDPFYTCAQNMFSNVPNTRGVYWTEFEIRSIYTG